jgi:ABC-2 type transport system permease protein
MYWSVRRELWENRSVTLAPLAVAAFTLLSFSVSTIGMPHRRRALLLLDAAKQRAAIGQPYDIAATMLLATAVIAGIFYCLDALYGERRDRSILFWKSMPVSDRTTVFAKASVPLVVLPIFTWILAIGTQLVMLVMSSIVLLPSGLAGTTFSRYNIIVEAVVLLYGLAALTLWWAPIYAWLLLVSAWARRAAFLWAVLPWATIAVLEQIAFNTHRFAMMLVSRFIGFAPKAFAFQQPHGRIESLHQLTPGTYLTTPGLWIGLILAAAFLAATVRLRRAGEQS